MVTSVNPSSAPAWQLLKRSGHQYALSLTAGSELLERVRPAPIPLPPRGVAGLISWKGEPVILCDLQLLLGGERSYLSTRALVIGQGAQAVALAIDSLPNIVRAHPAAQRPINSPWLLAPLSQCVSAWIVTDEGAILPVLEINPLMQYLTQTQ